MYFVRLKVTTKFISTRESSIFSITQWMLFSSPHDVPNYKLRHHFRHPLYSMKWWWTLNDSTALPIFSSIFSSHTSWSQPWPSKAELLKAVLQLLYNPSVLIHALLHLSKISLVIFLIQKSYSYLLFSDALLSSE
jgi:hypothetical protein